MYIYAENCKTEVEEVKYMKREREIMCSWIRKINVVKMTTFCAYSTQSTEQIQCNPYQNTMELFHRPRTNLKFSMQTQKNSNSQHNLEKEQS